MQTTLFCILIYFIFFKIKKHLAFKSTRSYYYPRILVYENISDKKNSKYITPQAFEKQIIYLMKKKFRFRKLDDAIKKRQYKSIILTFDKGLASQYKFVFPILKKYNIPGLFYLSPKYQNSKKMTEHNIVEMLNSRLIEIGSSAMHCVNLQTLLPAKNVIKEILYSKIFLEKKYGIICNHFSYPLNIYDYKITQVVQKSGYISAATQDGKSYNKNKYDLFEIPRIKIDSDVSFAKFKKIIKNGKL
ncbi:polysaccharide deacetylase family protein [Candidatus Deianiraea vastatrix]|uniref:Chitooligosaccharide deacetylase n=1 Tax=Candidatus Deianiraea vastatrix TaxID=2163644 RepID=A0A5B8XER5_9RICK|nr:polysaccharide deacetylase family protein [Candidatus Deianiraea vastatrix]QED23798.1 Putative polysaccharide deacetylase [Candidatus Deianiraea vastatrix]